MVQNSTFEAVFLVFQRDRDRVCLDEVVKRQSVVEGLSVAPQLDILAPYGYGKFLASAVPSGVLAYPEEEEER